MTHPAVADAFLQASRTAGWNVPNAGEARVALALGRLGYQAREVETQFSLGPYKLDFALVAQRLDIEADGWVHTAADVRRRDRIRDRRLRQWGWHVARIDLAGDVDAQVRALVPEGRRAERYAQALDRITAASDLALWRMSRQSAASAADSADLLSAAIRATCDRVSRRSP